MKTIEFKHNRTTYKVEATAYGVDIFKNGKYLDTKHTENKKTHAYWLGMGVEYIADLEQQHAD
jgi:hypothetical protein